MIDFESFIYNKKCIPQDTLEKEQFFKKLEEQFFDEIGKSEKAKSYLDQFYGADIEWFVKNYVQKKIQIIQSYEYYDYKYREYEDYELSFHKRAESALQAIQQKKLFNLQLLWRADQLKLEGVNICYDFMFWEKHITSCSFIEPVTESEKEMMKEYLLTKANDAIDDITVGMYVRWQDYEEQTKIDEHGLMSDMLDWYDFYDNRRGTGNLLLLPDIRGEKENFYFSVNRAIVNQSGSQISENVDTRPRLFGYGAVVVAFAEAYETDVHLRQLYKGYAIVTNRENKIPFPEHIESAVSTLSQADRNVYLPSHLNWDEALVYAAKQYINVKTAEALDIVYDEYCMFQEMGMIATESPEEIERLYKADDIVKLYRDAILKGRVLNGDSEDFNF